MYRDANLRTPFKKDSTGSFWRNRFVAITGKRCLRKNHLAEVFEAEPVAFNPDSFDFTVAGGRKQPGKKFYRSLREFFVDVVGVLVGRLGLTVLGISVFILQTSVIK
jgi:hypothetical protein